MRLWLGVLFGGVLLVGACRAALSQDGAPEEASNVRTAKVAEYRAHLESLRELVRGCEVAAAECDAKKVGDDERVEGMGFQTRWSWLREALNRARNAAVLAERDKILQGASSRLEEDAVLAGETVVARRRRFSPGAYGDGQGSVGAGVSDGRGRILSSACDCEVLRSGWTRSSAVYRGSASVRRGWFR